MKALICRAYGPPKSLVVEEADDMREPGPGDVIVRVKAAGLNYPDVLSVAGQYPIPSHPPFVPGIEGAGVVEAVGEGVTRVAPGDMVAWQNNEAKAAFAQVATLPEACLARVPDGLDPTVAACVPTVYGTAAFALGHRAGLRRGDTVVVHGASGGVGLAAVQIAREQGARVIATSRSADKRARLADLGVETVAADDRMRDRVLEVTGGRGADIVLDPVGGVIFDASIRMLAPYGRLLVIGFTSGDFGVARSNILLVKALSVIGVNYGHFLATKPDAARGEVEGLLSRIAEGRLRPVVEVLDGLDEIPGGLRRLDEGGVFGKLAVRV